MNSSSENILSAIEFYCEGSPSQNLGSVKFKKIVLFYNDDTEWCDNNILIN